MWLLNKENILIKFVKKLWKYKFLTTVILIAIALFCYVKFVIFNYECPVYVPYKSFDKKDGRAKQLKTHFFEISQKEDELMLGVPNVCIPEVYVPKRRLVHLDLKGAPPTVAFLQKLFPMIRNMGATGVLIEYEDMFPYNGPLSVIKAKNAYTEEEIAIILESARQSNLEIIPLIQTFGHVEFILKHGKFKKLREVPESPQAFCPNRNGSFDIIIEIVDQIMKLHPNIDHLHIGCDEVFQIGECSLCQQLTHETIFLRHVSNVTKRIKEKHPNVRLIIWDDMLRHVNEDLLLEYKLDDLIEPMVWVYAEDIYRFVPPTIWEKYSHVFKSAWTASAFKGAFGETLYVPKARRHIENNLRWLEVMSREKKYFTGGFSGIALTGWQRYDHFSVLCETLPVSLPSLALNLIAVSNGYFNSSLRNLMLAALSCPHGPNNKSFINLDTDPYMWEKLGRCLFPGSEIFRLTHRFEAIETEVIEYVERTRRQKGWMTDYNVRRNYSISFRVDELMDGYPRVYNAMLSLAKNAVSAMDGIFDNYTTYEWIEQRIYPYIIELERIQRDSVELKKARTWTVRPLPILKDLKRLGLT